MSALEQEKAYCPACGETVNVMVILQDGEEVPRCSNCGMAVQPLAKVEEGFSPLERVVFAEDSPGVRKVISTVLLGKNISKEATPTENGAEFISAVTRIFREHKTLDLAILDVMMPVLNGIQAALALRGLEKKFSMVEPTPILFFTSKVIDDRFRGVLKQCRPAGYVNKGNSPNAKDLAKRVYTVVRRMMSEM